MPVFRVVPGGYDEDMLSYLHGFHAGNAADVLKHSALVFCLTYLKKKETPILCVDTHAGAGAYNLSGTAFPRNQEWEKGIGRLLRTGGKETAGALPPMITDYLRFCIGPRGEYSGSPVIMARVLNDIAPQRGDRLVCFELHPREFETLKASLEEVRREGGLAAEVRREDGPGGLKALLPPPSRRGLVLIDPSWEEQSEYESIPRTVREGLRRFPGGTFIVWYPLLFRAKETGAAPVQDILFDLSGGKRCRVELCVRAAEKLPPDSPRGMYGSGLVLYNPPWTLRAALEETLPRLTEILDDGGGSWRLEWRE